jgi:hypothetical protein
MKSIKDSYQQYKEKSEAPVSLKEYLLIAAEFNQFLISQVLKGKEVTLPSNMGTLAIIGRKTKIKFEEGKVLGLAPDWVRTKQYWLDNPKAKAKKKILFHENNHTDGVRYKFLWSKKRVLVPNKTMYALRLTRANKRAVSKKITEGAQYKTI